MNKSILVMLALLSTSIFADERPEADVETIAELKQFCMEVAEEDGTGDMTMQMFLLKCVNQELEDEGYRPAEKLE